LPPTLVNVLLASRARHVNFPLAPTTVLAKAFASHPTTAPVSLDGVALIAQYLCALEIAVPTVHALLLVSATATTVTREALVEILFAPIIVFEVCVADMGHANAL